MLHHLPKALLLGLTLSMTMYAYADSYKIDPEHSTILFKASHLGISTLVGQIHDLNGTFNYDSKQPSSSNVTVKVKIDNLDTHQAERDKHLKSKDYLNASQFPEATFSSVQYNGTADQGVIEGNLEFMGVKKPIKIDVKKVGEGKDPWGGYRVGFEGKTTLQRHEFGAEKDKLGPNADKVDLEIFIEGIKS